MNTRDRQAALAAERLDVLEEPDELPVGICAVRGCSRGGMYYPQPSIAGGVRFICSRCRALYRDHDAIVRRIRALPERVI